MKIKKDDNINKMWESLLLALIGEQFEEPRVIGAALSLRTKERLLEVWLKDGRNDRVRPRVSNKLRQVLSLDPDSTTLYYKEHQKSIKDMSTMKNAEGFRFMKAGGSHNNHGSNASAGGKSVPHPHATSYKPHPHNNAQPWSGLQPGATSEEAHHSSGPIRRKSGAEEAQHESSSPDKPKPFSHLAATSNVGAGNNKHKVYRAKAPSHI